MCKIYQQSLRLSTYLLTSLLLLTNGLSAQAGKMLDGSARIDDSAGRGNAMSRSDINRPSSDPFGGGSAPSNGGGNQTIDAPDGAFQVAHMAGPPPPRPGNVQQDGQFGGNLSPGTAQPDNGGGQPGFARNDAPFNNQAQWGGPPPDPEQSGEMALAWDQWHKNVASVIYQRYSAGNAIFSHGPPLMVTVAYCVNRNGQITNVRFTQKSGNLMYNIYCMGVINSLNGDLSVLGFPPGSQRMAVDKAGSFEINTGNDGFKHTIHDNEHVRR